MSNYDPKALIIFCVLSGVLAISYVVIQSCRKLIKKKPAHRHSYSMRCICGKERFKSLDRKNF